MRGPSACCTVTYLVSCKLLVTISYRLSAVTASHQTKCSTKLQCEGHAAAMQAHLAKWSVITMELCMTCESGGNVCKCPGRAGVVPRQELDLILP